MCQYNKMFSHVYVEKGVAEHPRTKQILEKLNNTTVIQGCFLPQKAEYFCSKQCQGAHSGREYKRLHI